MEGWAWVLEPAVTECGSGSATCEQRVPISSPVEWTVLPMTLAAVYVRALGPLGCRTGHMQGAREVEGGDVTPQGVARGH